MSSSTSTPASRDSATSSATTSCPSISEAGDLGQATLEIDLAAIAGNWRRIAAAAGPAEVGAVVKADAYGLGAARVAPALAAAGCRTFFVAHPAEGLELRRHLPDQRILVLHGAPADSAEALADAALIPVLNTPGQVGRFAALARAQGRKLPAAIQIDTGMTRVGLSAAETGEMAERRDMLDALDLRLVLSHLACGDEAEHPMNQAQLAEFERLKALLPPAPASLANSAGCFLGPAFGFDLMRPGIALYGGRPLANEPNPMGQVVRLTAKILQTHQIDTPRTVGYGATHSMPAGSRIATVAVGYADGYPRSLSDRGLAAIGGSLVPVVGRVSMDLITLDVTALPATVAHEGAEVVLLGDTVPQDMLAGQAGTIDYELLTRLGRRYRRVYRGH